VRRLEGHTALLAEAQAVMQFDGQLTQFGSKPASVGVNPIALSGDGKTLYFGAMTGQHWYSAPRLREGTHEQIAATLRSVASDLT
jgi:hypothetical protein